ncbi:MAG: hypothetical protein WEB30_19235 [Cyclobacteriaceae bacterium]
MKRASFLLLVFTLCAAALEGNVVPPAAQRAGRYYFSEKGNDDNNGTSELSPWRSLTKLAERGRLLPGDSVLLERGSVFFGTLSIYGNGTRTSGIYVGSYGAGVDPVIKGSVELKNRTRFEDNIWVAHCQLCNIDRETSGQDRRHGRRKKTHCNSFTT